MTHLRLGFAVNVSTASRDLAEVTDLYEGLLGSIVYAEQLGLDSVWVGQHHFDNTPGPVPSPLLVLATAACRTSRITLGTGITTIPFEDPIRLAEDAVTADLLAGGRIHLGLGTAGANLEGFAAFGLDPERRHDVFGAKVVDLHRILDGSPIGGPNGPHLYPPGDRVRRHLWQAAGTVAEAQAAADAGDGLQQGAFYDPAGSGQRPKVEAYLQRWAEHGRESDPQVAVFRFVYPGADKDEVLRRVAPALEPRLAVLGARAARSGNQQIGRLSVREYLDQVTFRGSPTDIAEQVHTDPAIAAGATDFVANFSYGAEFDVARLRHDLETLAHRIGPEIGWRPAAATGAVA